MKLFMVMLGATPKGRFTEQHDIFFGIANSLQELVPEMKAFWPNTKIHIDAWREVTKVENYTIEIIPQMMRDENSWRLFFLNLGGYRENEFEEYHYKLLTVSNTIADAAKKAKTTAFYKHFGFKGAVSHIDNKFGIDVDDAHDVQDILPTALASKFSLRILENDLPTPEDLMHIGYLSIEKLEKSN